MYTVFLVALAIVAALAGWVGLNVDLDKPRSAPAARMIATARPKLILILVVCSWSAGLFVLSYLVTWLRHLALGGV